MGVYGFVPLVVLGLAVWRICLMVVLEEGPICCRVPGASEQVGLFVWLRSLVALLEMERPDALTRTLVGLVGCVWCLSVWVGFGAVGLWLLWPRLTMLLALPFALSALAILFQAFTDRG